MSKENEDKWRESHSSFITKLAHFVKRLQDLYQPGMTGIVTAAGRPNFGQVISLVLMTRQVDSHLPIQVILDSSEAWVEYVFGNIFPGYNATCVELKDVWAGVHPFVQKLGLQSFQWKLLSIIPSTFQNVLFLDSDALPVLNPDLIFNTGAELFTSTGFISWPDFWTQSASSTLFNIFGDVEVPLTSRTTLKSRIMVCDKARHADILLLAAYYNFNGPVHYYPITTQYGPVEGDKKTFFLAAFILEAVER
jgi:Mannosyltransferase putative.